MRSSLQMAALVVVLLLLVMCQAGSLGLRGTSPEQSDATNTNTNDDGKGSSNTESTSNRLRPQSPPESHLPPTSTTAKRTKKKEPKKYRMPGQQTRREKWCEPHQVEVCGQGLGHLLCEYNPDKQAFATRCVRQAKTSLHLQLHPRNSCGACRRCFETTDELRLAVAEYLANNTDNTPVAHNYGWPMNQWCVDKIQDFSHLFAHHRKFREPIGEWNVGSARNMSGMFASAFSFNSDLSNWNTARVVDMSDMFDGAYAFNQPLESWNTAQVTTMSRMFQVAKAFDQSLANWNTSQVQDMSFMFYRGHAFDQSVAWDVSRVVDMTSMFGFTRRFNHPSVMDWDVSRVQSMRGLFQNTGAFDQDVSSWQVGAVHDFSFMFDRAQSLDQDKQRAIVTKWDLSSSRNKHNMFTFLAEGALLNATHNFAEAEGVTLMHPSYYDDSKTMAHGINVETSSNEVSLTTSTHHHHHHSGTTST